MFFVIFVHTVNDGIMAFTKFAPDTFPYWFYLLMASLGSGGVCCFWMITGTLLLDKEESLKSILKNRVFKTTIVLLVFLMFYYIVDSGYKLRNIDLLTFANHAYTGKLEAVLWFLYAYIALLLALPLQKRLVQNLDNWHFIYMGAIYIIFIDVLPIIEELFLHQKDLLTTSLKPYWVLSSSMVYSSVGYFLCKKLKEINLNLLIKLITIDIFLRILMCIFVYYKSNIISDYKGFGLIANFGRFELLHAATMVLLFRYVIEHHKLGTKMTKFIIELGSATYGIYLFHIFFLWKVWPIQKFRYQVVSILGLNPFSATIWYVIEVMILGYVTTWELKKIPGVKKFI